VNFGRRKAMNSRCWKYNGDSTAHKVVVARKERGRTMKRRRIEVTGLVILMFNVILLSWGCTSARTRTGSIPDIRLIDTVLHPGVSIKEDVQALLGKPNGYGGAVLPMGHIPYDVWFYNLIEASVQASGGAGRIDVQMEVLLIFFEKEVYDGHMWFKDFTTGRFH
jgi:hypothetical protein